MEIRNYCPTCNEVHGATQKAIQYRDDAEHWRREAELRQSLLENERQLCAIHEAKRDEALAHIESNDAWEARLREALGDLLESLGYDCEGPFDPEADGGCANGCPKCRVEGLLG